MIYKVEVRSPQGDLLTLELDDISDGILVKEITGLDPVKATLVSSSFAQQDGSYYQSSRRENRNIGLVLGLVPDPAVGSVRSVRNGLYRYFMSEAAVSLRFFDDEDDLTVDIDGVVESMESALFTDDPAVDISIVCFDPDFVVPTPTTLTGLNTSTTASTTIEYTGTIDVGIQLVLSVDRTMTGFTIYHTLPSGEVQSLDFQAALTTGDVVTLSTVEGAKSVNLLRSGTTSSLLYAVSPQSKWIALKHGTNHVQVYATGAGVPLTIAYTPRYGGL